MQAQRTLLLWKRYTFFRQPAFIKSKGFSCPSILNFTSSPPRRFFSHLLLHLLPLGHFSILSVRMLWRVLSTNNQYLSSFDKIDVTASFSVSVNIFSTLLRLRPENPESKHSAAWNNQSNISTPKGFNFYKSKEHFRSSNPEVPKKAPCYSKGRVSKKAVKRHRMRPIEGKDKLKLHLDCSTINRLDAVMHHKYLERTNSHWWKSL